MTEINLLDVCPKPKRNLDERAAALDREREIARRYGREYFDGERTQGYGGYYYDGRWVAVAKRMRDHYGLKPGSRILDVGCAKGFLMHDFLGVLGRATVRGIDVSAYAIENALSTVRPYIVRGSADDLPFEDRSFDFVVSLNTLHNLPRERCLRSLQEIQRVARGPAFVQLDAYRTEEERRRQERWILTAHTWMSVDEWTRFFAEAGYTGDAYWTIP